MEALSQDVGNIRETKNIEINGIVDVKKNPLNFYEWTDLFIKWIEDNNWTFGGITSAYDDE